MMHPYIIDTSVIFNLRGIRKKKPGRWVLCERFLNENVQGSYRGHTSIEDSSASMRLVKLKLTKNEKFGDAARRYAMGSCLIQSIKQKEKDIAKNVIQVLGKEQSTASLFYLVANDGKNVGVIGTQETIKYCDIKADKSNICGYVEDTSESIINRACEVAKEKDFLLTHVCLKEEKLEEKIEKINEWTEKMLEITPVKGMCLVLLGNAKGSCGVCFIGIKEPTVPASLS